MAMLVTVAWDAWMMWLALGGDPYPMPPPPAPPASIAFWIS